MIDTRPLRLLNQTQLKTDDRGDGAGSLPSRQALGARGMTPKAEAARSHVDRIMRCVGFPKSAALRLEHGPMPVVEASWRRCVVDYGLNPLGVDKVDILTRADTRLRAKAVEELFPFARGMISTLSAALRDEPHTILLADAGGRRPPSPRRSRPAGTDAADGDRARGRLGRAAAGDERHRNVDRGRRDDLDLPDRPFRAGQLLAFLHQHAGSIPGGTNARRLERHAAQSLAGAPQGCGRTSAGVGRAPHRGHALPVAAAAMLDRRPDVLRRACWDRA